MAESVFFGHFEVERDAQGGLRELGRGAMGITYRAFDANLRCPVALKIIKADRAGDTDARERFLREARAAARLRHPNVATVLHLGEEDGDCYYAMELIAGETLEQIVGRRGALPPALVLDVALQVGSALAAAYREGLVHRDIKPANLMLISPSGGESVDSSDELHVKVIDFGLAKIVDRARAQLSAASADLSMEGFFGSPYFASPEQGAGGGELDIRSDFYNLGCTMWWLLTGGAPPFRGNFIQVIGQHATRPPPFEELAARGVPAAMIALLRRLLAKEPDERPADPAALRVALQECRRALVAVGEATGGGGPPSGGDNLYETVAEIARGRGSARLVQARVRSEQGRIVALRYLDPTELPNLDTRAGVERAVALLAQNPHPGLRRFYAFGSTETGTPFLVIEWIEGQTLLDVLRARGSLAPREALPLLEQAAAALDAAAANGLERIDLAPARVVLRGGSSAGGELGGCQLKLNAIDIPVVPEAGDTVTLTPPPPLRSTDPAALRESYARELARLAYEILGGPAAALTARRTYVPLTNISEAGNTVLRRGFAPGPGADYSSPGEFQRALATAVTATATPAADGRGGNKRKAFAAEESSGLKGDGGGAPAPRPAWLRPAIFGAAALALFVVGSVIVKKFRRSDDGNRSGETTAISPTPVPPPIRQEDKLAPTPPSAASGARTLAVPAAFRTIQAALDAARSGDTVQVSAGSYEEGLTFKDGVRLLGDGSDKVTVRIGATVGRALTVSGCKSGVISGLTFEHIGVNGTPNPPALVALIGSNVEFSHCRVRHGGGAGLIARGGDTSTIMQCEIDTCANDGIFVSEKSTAPTIKNCNVHGNTMHGIDFDHGPAGLAEYNQCDDNALAGIMISGAGTAPTARANYARRNRLAGILVAGGAGEALIESNVCEENRGAGLEIADPNTSPILRKNEAFGNKEWGILFMKGARGVAENNTCERNGGAGIGVAGAGTAPTLRGNRLAGNKGSNLYVEKGAVPIVAR